MKLVKFRSQSHGFIWEREILKNIYGVKQFPSYTSKYDLNAKENIIDGLNVSIKTSGGKSVDMSDIIRFYTSISKNKFLNLIIIFYKQEENYKILKKIINVKLKNEHLKLLFGCLDLEKDIKPYTKYIKSIPKGDPGNIRNEYREKQKKLNELSGFIKLRTKVDMKNQRRVQCSFPNFLEFCSHLEIDDFIINEKGLIHNKQITMKLFSKKRRKID